MQKIIWACWFQGRDTAPELVRKCLLSWEEQNPGWELRCLDSYTISNYLDLPVDLEKQTITAPSLSDILRALLLHEFGGVWVDATTFCNAPLDVWLPSACSSGFFAFAETDWNRLVHSWFLATEPGNPLIAKWAARIVRYWHGRERTEDYFWMHRQFAQLCTVDRQALMAWRAVPKIDGFPIHIIQTVGMFEDFDTVESKIDWALPLFKLTNHFDASKLTDESLLARLLKLSGESQPSPPVAKRAPQSVARPICTLNSFTDDIGDYIQVIAAECLHRRAGFQPPFTLDRDGEITDPPPLPVESRSVMHLNRWYKYPAITFPKRLPHPDSQTETFVVSQNHVILSYLPASIGRYTYISHSTESHKFSKNKHRAAELLMTYRDRAKLIVTTMPDCALLAIAMGIPVVVFYPHEQPICKDGIARLSVLSEVIPVFNLSEANLVNWQGYASEVSTLKLRLIETFCSMADERRWLASRSPLGPMAPLAELPFSFSDVPCDRERLDELMQTKSPDRHRWGARSSYDPGWATRSQVAAQFIEDGSRVLEVGTGLGTLRELIKYRCNYTGADLQPLDDHTLAIDLDSDLLPHGSWDIIVLLGVLEHLYRPSEALRKLVSATPNLIISYACCIDEDPAGITARRGLGWTNAMTERDLTDELGSLGFRLHAKHLLSSTFHYDEILFQFVK